VSSENQNLMDFVNGVYMLMIKKCLRGDEKESKLSIKEGKNEKKLFIINDFDGMFNIV
jgi:hypothetical protein